jgi:hypothetical protein
MGRRIAALATAHEKASVAAAVEMPGNAWAGWA